MLLAATVHFFDTSSIPLRNNARLLHTAQFRELTCLIGQVCGLAAGQAQLSKATRAPPFSSKPRLIDQSRRTNTSQSKVVEKRS